MDKKKADQQASPKHSSVENTTTQAQRARLLDALELGPITTIDARSRLNIMMPAARVKELRSLGHPIVTHLRDLYDDQGRRHSRVAVYYLAGRGQEVA
ncbi:helix-turn-helix domain-containing protein [Pseudomonas sp. Snoq117.2]|uniref:helix-turn-helix domain-containing protein n=1 Tax=Pseudomonas sp. Snoq117.2 TaxID=1500302 RepID=UPI0008C62C5B|nr:helix-turn-helix domain-containing protein [Pseudomonas sp. Snoq117.2]SEO71374.1 Helix-turn-helix domain-containing protein [Pseudomonas sp. Snoq117.2]